MREILFRGKCNEVGKYNGHWIEGHYGEDEGRNEIFFSTKIGIVGYSCEPESIGQYTGLTDKNGRKIFEGDILKIHYTTELFGETLSTQYNALVMFEDGCNVAKSIFDGAELVNVLSAFSNDEVEAIGNIHDNPELLEVGK